MYKIIRPNQFKTIPWKNGQGQTTELAINETGNLTEFDWRLSIASVAVDGPFSDFSGYDRQLILLSGNGIKLTHKDELNDQVQVDELLAVLSKSTFDGSNQTTGELCAGPIRDFNVITNQQTMVAAVDTFAHSTTTACQTAHINFIYAANHTIECHLDNHEFTLPAHNLLQIKTDKKQLFHVSGEGFIVASIHKNPGAGTL